MILASKEPHAHKASRQDWRKGKCAWVRVYAQALVGWTATAEIAFISDLILSVIRPQAQ